MYRNTDLSELAAIAKSGNLAVIISPCFGLIGNTLRGCWGFCELTWLPSSGSSIVYATFWVTCCFVLPRAGDVWRVGKWWAENKSLEIRKHLLDKVIDVVR